MYVNQEMPPENPEVLPTIDTLFGSLFLRLALYRNLENSARGYVYRLLEKVWEDGPSLLESLEQGRPRPVFTAS
jgi:hypothetical protein